MASDDPSDLARKVGIPYVRLSDTVPSAAAMAVVPVAVARHCRAVPLAVAGGTLTVAMVDPHDQQLLSILAEAANMPIFPVVGSEAEIASVLDSWERLASCPPEPRAIRFPGASRSPRRPRRHIRR